LNLVVYYILSTELSHLRLESIIIVSDFMTFVRLDLHAQSWQEHPRKND